MHLYIKNMVCNRCIMVVKQEFEKHGVKPIGVILGEVDLPRELSQAELETIGTDLKNIGFEILDDQRKRQIEKIKKLLIDLVQSGQIDEHLVLSDFLSNKLNKEYTQLSRLFSEVEGIILEQFFILQKIEKVKEWLVYDELSLSQISYKLGYSSVAHLSSQFKKVTGLTPSHFKKLGGIHRKSIDNIRS